MQCDAPQDDEAPVHESCLAVRGKFTWLHWPCRMFARGGANARADPGGDLLAEVRCSSLSRPPKMIQRRVAQVIRPRPVDFPRTRVRFRQPCASPFGRRHDRRTDRARLPELAEFWHLCRGSTSKSLRGNLRGHDFGVVMGSDASLTSCRSS